MSEADHNGDLGEVKDTLRGVEVPAGITIRDIRSAVPAHAQIIIEFCAQGTEGWDFNIGEKGFYLRANESYIVGSNPERQGDLYLNSLLVPENEHNTSDIPYILDENIAKAQFREQMGVTVRIRSDDVDLPKVFSQIDAKRKDIEQFNQFESEFYAEGSRARLGLEKRVSETYPGLIISGERLEAVLLGMTTEGAYREFMKKAEIGESVDWSQKFEGWIDECVLQLDFIYKNRLPDLKSRVSGKNELAIAIDDVYLGGDPGVRVLTVYKPGKGWTIIYPNFNCPQQAAAALEDQVFNSSGKTEFPQLSAEVAEAQKQGELIIDTDAKVVVYKKMDQVRYDMAVYHGDGKLVDLIGTLRMAGDPWDGTRVFHQIIIGQEELDLEIGEPMSITMEDIQRVRKNGL